MPFQLHEIMYLFYDSFDIWINKDCRITIISNIVYVIRRESRDISAMWVSLRDV